MINKEKRIQLYRAMKRVRKFEMRSIDMYKRNEMPGFLHPCVGQEATVSGTANALRPDDLMLTNHRGHGHLIAKGGDVNKIMAELYGKVTGYCKGKGGSMHVADFSKGMLGACGIVGGGIPIAVGAALSSKLQGTRQVAVTFFGDGASNEGSFHESINFAAVQKLPVIFLVENNGYGEFTPQCRAMCIEDIADRAKGYGIPGVIVDGMDAVAVYTTVAQWVEKLRNGEGPVLIEAKTHRKSGHSEGEVAFLDGQPYRLPEEEKIAKETDCIDNLRQYLLANTDATQADLDAIDQAAAKKIEDAVEFAKNSPFPTAEDLFTDTWV